jgi:hypothetical protein
LRSGVWAAAAGHGTGFLCGHSRIWAFSLVITVSEGGSRVVVMSMGMRGSRVVRSARRRCRTRRRPALGSAARSCPARTVDGSSSGPGSPPRVCGSGSSGGARCRRARSANRRRGRAGADSRSSHGHGLMASGKAAPAGAERAGRGRAASRIGGRGARGEARPDGDGPPRRSASAVSHGGRESSHGAGSGRLTCRTLVAASSPLRVD